jgi:ribosomal protein S7
MIFKKNFLSLFICNISNKIFVKEKLNNNNNLLKLKYLNKYFGLKNKKVLVKIQHNKIFFLRVKKNIIIRKNSKQNYKQKISLVPDSSLKRLNLYGNFISFIFKSGKKYIWEKIISDIFLLAKKKIKISQNIILLKVFLRLYSKIEVKKIKTRRKVTLVPVFISVRRRFYLVLKWLLSAVNQNKLKISLKEKLFLEIYKVIKNKSCESVKLLKLNNQNVYLNRANFHFRW